MPEAATTASASSASPIGSPSGQAAHTAADSSATSNSSQNSQTQPQTTAPAARPEWLPEKFWDGTKNEPKHTDFRAEYDSLSAFKAAEDSRRLSLPQQAGDYKVGTSAAFKPPEGVEFKIDTNNPLWSQAQSWAHKNGLSQDAFHEAVDLFAGYQIGDAQSIKTAREGEIAKLGTAGPARFDAVMTWARAMVGEAGAQEIAKGLFTAKQVEAFEGLIRKFVSQGAGAPSGAHREPPQQHQKLTDEQYSKLTYTEKKAYAAQFKPAN